MSAVAGIAAVRRTQRRFSGIWAIGLAAVAGSAWVVTGIALAAIIDPQFVQSRPAQYAVPLLGMVLGNTLTGISLGLDRLTGDLVSGRDAVELRLSLGATRWEAALPAIRDAVRTGMIPIINSMMVVGIVSLPGMMTGQILAGVEDPMSAVRYQIVIMFLIAAGVVLGVTGATLLSYRRLFNARHQFLGERIRSVTDG
jgi:putative ABC transport system permease protein